MGSIAKNFVKLLSICITLFIACDAELIVTIKAVAKQAVSSNCEYMSVRLRCAGYDEASEWAKAEQHSWWWRKALGNDDYVATVDNKQVFLGARGWDESRCDAATIFLELQCIDAGGEKKSARRDALIGKHQIGRHTPGERLEVTVEQTNLTYKIPEAKENRSLKRNYKRNS